MRPLSLNLCALLVAVMSLAACDMAKERVAENQLGYDVEYYEDENGEQQMRPTDGPIALQVEFDQSRLEDIRIPDGYVVTDVVDNPDFGSVSLSLTAQDDDDVDAAASEFESMLDAGGWVVERGTGSDGSIQLDFVRDPSSGSATFRTDPAFGTVSIRVSFTPDTTAAPWLAFDLPTPEGLVDRTVAPNEWTFTVDRDDLETIVRDYASALEAAGWTVASVGNDAGFWAAEFSAEGQIGLVRALPARSSDASTATGSTTVTVRVFQN